MRRGLCGGTGTHFLFFSLQPSLEVPLCKRGWFCSPGLDASQSLSNHLRKQVETQLTPESASRTCPL